jgi:hypothetical protein
MKPDEARMALVGQKCWYVSAGGKTAPSFMLALGDQVPRERPLRNPAQSPEFRKFRGSVELLVWCSWRLQRSAAVLASSDQGATGLPALQAIINLSVTDVVCSPPAWDLLVRFSDGLELVVFCDHVAPDASIEQNWELWSPQGHVGTGPGAEWGEDPLSPA